jgi:hypothetical protein
VRNDVEQAIAKGIVARMRILGDLTHDQRVALLDQLLLDTFAAQHQMLQKWAALTGQSAQVDTGYFAQFVASIVIGKPGQGFRGKGDDLVDGSEVKAAANISGVDRPRWNHNLGTPADDARRRAKGLLTAAQVYLSSPYLFYLLADRPTMAQGVARPLRVRAWLIDGRLDTDWRDLVTRYADQRTPSMYNLQLHPPVGWDDNLVVNTLGNLDFSEVLVFDARIVHGTDGASIDWHVPLPANVLPVTGRTRAKHYGVGAARPSQLTGAEDIVVDVAVIPKLFPDILPASVAVVIDQTLATEGVVGPGMFGSEGYPESPGLS